MTTHDYMMGMLEWVEMEIRDLYEWCDDYARRYTRWPLPWPESLRESKDKGRKDKAVEVVKIVLSCAGGRVMSKILQGWMDGGKHKRQFGLRRNIPRELFFAR